jgi:glyoxylase-like metal-dependent hydrolase (beta-lactamase superfamily II)
MPALAQLLNSRHSPYVPDPQIQPFSPGIWVWQNYDPEIKTDLWSSAVQAESGVYLVDPIPLNSDQIIELSASRPIAGVIVTNGNHERAAVEISDRFSVPIFAYPSAFSRSRPARFSAATEDPKIGGDLEVIAIEGAAPGEIALYQSANGGTLIVGDALINFDPYGFALLPKKYCENQKRMRSSLRQLLNKPADRMLFAHGMPILSSATARLRELLESQ